MKIKAWNAFSCLEVEVFDCCDDNIIKKLNSPDEHLLSINRKMVITLQKTVWLYLGIH